MNPNALFLFQGDSITDAGRGRTDDQNHILGHGYAFLIAAKLGAEFAEKNWRFVNRGISGNRVVDLYARWKEDTLNLKPDLLSILIGVNDVWHQFSRQAGVPAARFANTYRLILEEAKEHNPELRLVIGEPFILQTGAPAKNWDEWKSEVCERASIAQKLAKEFGATYVPFQKVFDEACDRAPAPYWLWDGVHPTYAGHQLMADAWLNAVAIDTAQ